MTKSRGLRYLSAALLAGAAAGVLIFADEGMWTFDNPPSKQLQERYGFTPSQEWLDRIRLASVRMGASGSFVSSNGLVLTNHHVAMPQLQKLSTPEKNLVTGGFYAATLNEELKTPDFEAEVLVSMQNVTDRVLSVVKPGLSEEQALEARKGEMAKIEKESLDATGLQPQVVSLYNGGEYWLYSYKRYTDIRLVFAPEQLIAFFGGDPDNFTYPRYDLDFAFFRIYENGKPVEGKQFLKVNPQGAAEGELVFVSGNPGETNRLQTVAQIKMQRDHWYPFFLEYYKNRLEALRRYAAKGAEEERQAMNQIFSIENALKAWTGEYQGLLSESLIAKKEKEEEEFRALVLKAPELKTKYGDAWEILARSAENYTKIVKPLHLHSLQSRLGSIAFSIVQYVVEVKKPDAERLDGYHEAQLEPLRFRILSPAPVYPELEKATLTDHFQQALARLGPEDPFLKAALQGKSSEAVVKAAVEGTKLGDPSVRKALMEGGEEAVKASADPLIMLARRIDPTVRQTRKSHEEQVESLQTSGGEKIGKARFGVYGKAAYPDATFTLRLAYGTVKGYPMNGTIAPPKTTLFGLYDRAHSFNLQEPFQLPERYVNGRDKLDLSTPMNFVNTADIIGGNSGSPVINRNGELVGLIFDGNIESLVSNFIYDEEKNRAVAVHSAVIIETLRKLYGADSLVKELLGHRGTEAPSN